MIQDKLSHSPGCKTNPAAIITAQDSMSRRSTEDGYYRTGKPKKKMSRLTIMSLKRTSARAET